MSDHDAALYGYGPGDDPGWGLRAGRRAPVSVLRMILLVVLQALVLLLVVLAVLMPVRDPAVAVDPVVYALLGLSLAGPVGGMWTRRRPLQCAEPANLAGQYQTLFFVGLALSESAALFGFVAAFLADGYWPYLVGVALSGIGFALIAPTRVDIARRDEQLSMSGCPTSLRQALSSPVGPQS
jgi:F0F1-type ATP synthase membrane subunit c/vacuolar-type H+-ATPase subunit K